MGSIGCPSMNQQGKCRSRNSMRHSWRLELDSHASLISSCECSSLAPFHRHALCLRSAYDRTRRSAAQLYKASTEERQLDLMESVFSLQTCPHCPWVFKTLLRRSRGILITTRSLTFKIRTPGMRALQLIHLHFDLRLLRTEYPQRNICNQLSMRPGDRLARWAD